MKENNPIYERNTLEFVTVALEYCAFIEQVKNTSGFNFIDKATKLLPLLYLKAALLPEIELDDDPDLEQTITEETYESVKEYIATLLGEYDAYLDTFHPDMQYSDAPIAAFISENLADIYQDTGDFVALFRQGNEEVMQAAISVCHTNFMDYWGQSLLNALKALHTVRYNTNLSLESTENEEEE